MSCSRSLVGAGLSPSVSEMLAKSFSVTGQPRVVESPTGCDRPLPPGDAAALSVDGSGDDGGLLEGPPAARDRS